MYYCIVTADIAHSAELRKSASAAHMARLNDLKNQARLLTAGPFPHADSHDTQLSGVSGSLIIAEFASLPEAQRWADADPFVVAGVYDTVSVKPYKPILP